MVAGLGLNRARAQTFTNLYNFTNSVNAVNGNPVAGLIVAGNLLYGATYYGGTNNNGVIFSINTDGTGFTALHTFSPTVFSGSAFTNSDGNNPVGLILSGNMLYGMANSGGTNGTGTVFVLNTNGNGFLTLHTFSRSVFDPNVGSSTNADGENPEGGLVMSGNTLYGTTWQAGTNGFGTVFAVHTDGSGFTTLHSFNGGASDSQPGGDGGNPAATLIVSGSMLYGTTEIGGTNGWGTVFAVNTNGTGYVTLHNFKPYNYNAQTQTLTTNNDGATPAAGLILSGNTLYGTTQAGGTNGNGVVFAINTNGTETPLYSFSLTNGASANSDGANPISVLVLSGNTLYGTTEFGGAHGNGTVFAINTDGTGFAAPYSFNPVVLSSSGSYTNYGGANPKTGLVLSGNMLFGTANGGGSYGRQFGGGGGIFGGGTVFALTLSSSLGPVPLSHQINGKNLVLTWGNPAFFLQSAPAVTGLWTTIFGATSPYSTTMTNPMHYFRLVYTNSP
jgi:uncharacterized repeat protein (TIGR03803 family)